MAGYDKVTSQWYTSLEELSREYPNLGEGDVIAFKRPFLLHYATIVEKTESGDYWCVNYGSTGSNIGSSSSMGTGNVELLLLSTIANGDPLRIDNQYDKKPGFSERLGRIVASNPVYNAIRFNCECAANYLRSERIESNQPARERLEIGIGVALLAGAALVGFLNNRSR